VVKLSWNGGLGRRFNIRESPRGDAVPALFVETEATGFEFLGNLLLARGCRSQRGQNVRLLF
jgi:hypothetical protein